MKNSPTVSILVPTYNRADTLDRTLRSILDQTFRDFELIVVDDGSTDETRFLIDSFQDARLRYIYQENSGVAGARAKAMSACQGSYWAFCDSDDLWVPEKLEKQLAAFTQDTALVFSDAYAASEMFPQPKVRFRCYELSTPFRGKVYEQLIRRNFIVTSSVVVRRPFLEDFVVYPVTNFDDWQTWLWVARRNGTFEYVDQPLVYYYEHSEGISKQKISATKCRIIIRKHELDLIKRKQAPAIKRIELLRLLVWKDKLLLGFLKCMPPAVMRRLITFYYKSFIMRKVALKLGLGS